MAREGKTEVNTKVVGQILNGDAVERDMMRRLRRVQDAFGPGLEISTQKGRTRIQASAITATRKARARQARDGALTRAADAAGGNAG